MKSPPIGSVIGVVAGLVFVLVNAASVPASTVWRVAAVVAAIAVTGLLLRTPDVGHEEPRRSAIRVYGFAVTAMVLAIPLGAAVIGNALDAPDAVAVWVVFLVGAHFWPFSRAFGLPVFRWLSVALMTTAAVGLMGVLLGDDALAAGWTGVAAGFVLLAFAAVGPRLTTE